MNVRLLGCVLCVLGACGQEAVEPAEDASLVASHNAAIAAMGAYDYDGAMAILAPLTDANPDWSHGHVDLAIAQLNRQAEGDEEESLARLARVLQREPDNLRARYCAGLLRLNAGDIPAAAADFAAVAGADPLDAYALYYTGQSKTQLGDYAGALVAFERAIELDPYLRSTYYAGAQAARRAGDVQRAQDWLDTFHRMEHNPRARLAEIKYTRMGPKAEVRAMAPKRAAEPGPRPAGPVFDAGQVVGAVGGPVKAVACGWIGAGQSLILLAREDGVDLRRYSASEGLQAADGPGSDLMESISNVTAPLWGDVDGDGQLDVVLGRDGPDQLWLGTEHGSFELDERFPGGDDEAVDGALFDADHDGDLDVLIVSRDAPATLLNNNGDGTWQPVVDETSGFPGAMTDGREVVVADFDGDLDTDVLLIGQSPPHHAWLNDRLWNWQSAPEGWASLLHSPIAAAVAADMNADGAVDLVTTDGRGSVFRWEHASDGWARNAIVGGPTGGPTSGQEGVEGRRLAVADVTGDGMLNVLAADPGRGVVEVFDAGGAAVQTVPSHTQWMLIQGKASEGPALMSAGASGEVMSTPAGPGRFAFVDVTLSGRTDTGQSMRSNVSGIGATVAARVGTRWTIAGAVRSSAGPGQSLQPLSIGLAGAAAVDFVSIDWTDGVFQTEAMLQPGQVHAIAETQRQLSSCPVIFAWDGEAMRFQTDCLGVGGLGFLVGADAYATPRPRERVLLTGPPIAPRLGSVEVLLAEPMQETCYLDSVSLEAVDLPPGWEVLPDERMGTAPPHPTSELLYSRASLYPVSATGPDGGVLEQLRCVDGVAVDPGPLDGRFIGRLEQPLQLELDFGSPLDADGHPLVLVLDGWVEYPYSQTMFAAWQAGRTYRPLTIEALGGDGTWHLVHEDVGYPAGMTRRCVLPLEQLPRGATALRLRTDLELYLDAVRVAVVEPPDGVVVAAAGPQSATLEDVGYPRRRVLPGKRPGFDWSDRRPFWDVRSQRGEYTRLGPVEDLVDRQDGVLAVFGAGEAIRLRFNAFPPPPAGWTRQYVLDLAGWCKDMDLMTRSGATVEPVPGVATPRRDRHRSGR
ncbi:MAG: FG-GAP-like repeat-containing protein [Phycisphaerales bacterium]|jgi:hypothetical protein|nr:FG-GAP-like repeat-containing protein [Phycisphaerales bacterium]